MNWADRLTLFSPLDFLALALLLTAWVGIGWLIENPPRSRPSVSVIMVFYRRAWMHEFVERNPRVFDAQILGSLRQGTAFFVSATMLAIGGGFALIGNTERLAGIAGDLTLSRDPAFVLEIKLAVMIFIIANGFLKFVWAHRLFGYCSVVLSAVPNDVSDPAAYPRSEKAAEINITAARNFNRAMRSVYFGLAAATWLVGAPALIVGALLTLFVLWRREFASQSREALIAGSDGYPGK